MYNNNFRDSIDKQAENEGNAIRRLCIIRPKNHNKKSTIISRLTAPQIVSTARLDAMIKRIIDNELNCPITLL